MKNETYLFVPQPCHEGWENMVADKNGRFCASCAKTVVDFSLMTDNEVLAYLSKNTGKLCVTNPEEYEVQILDKGSRMLYIQKHTTTLPKETIEIPLPPNAAAGMYYIRLINTKTKKQWVDKLVVM